MCNLNITRGQTPIATIFTSSESSLMVSSLLITFPQEIIDHVIGTIDVYDKVLLRTCVLVSRSFLHTSLIETAILLHFA
jgi:hypothetical protein